MVGRQPVPELVAKGHEVVGMTTRREKSEMLGARGPMRAPRWVGRLAADEGVAVMMTEVRGASNEKAKRELDWQPRCPSWGQGFANRLG